MTKPADGPEAILTVRLLRRQKNGRLGWEDHCWRAPVDAADPDAVRAEVLKHTRDYLAGRELAGVQWESTTCARPVDGLH